MAYGYISTLNEKLSDDCEPDSLSACTPTYCMTVTCEDIDAPVEFAVSVAGEVSDPGTPTGGTNTLSCGGEPPLNASVSYSYSPEILSSLFTTFGVRSLNPGSPCYWCTPGAPYFNFPGPYNPLHSSPYDCADLYRWCSRPGGLVFLDGPSGLGIFGGGVNGCKPYTPGCSYTYTYPGGTLPVLASCKVILSKVGGDINAAVEINSITGWWESAHESVTDCPDPGDEFEFDSCTSWLMSATLSGSHTFVGATNFADLLGEAITLSGSVDDQSQAGLSDACRYYDCDEVNHTIAFGTHDMVLARVPDLVWATATLAAL